MVLAQTGNYVYSWDMVKRDRSYKGTKEPELVKARQDAFLVAYGEVGSIRAACRAAEMGRSTVDQWVRQDAQGFRGRFAVAKEMFREYLQDLAVGRIMEQKPNDNPILLVTLLNAHWPEKYRREAQAVGNEVKEMMVEWKKWISDNKKKTRTKEETKVVDEAEQARLNAIDEVEKILSRRGRVNDNSSEN